jgi:hypothetical protein
VRHSREPQLLLLLLLAALAEATSEATNAQCFSVLLLLKQKQEGAKKGLTADLCVSVSKSGHPSLYSPSFGRFLPYFS